MCTSKGGQSGEIFSSCAMCVWDSRGRVCDGVFWGRWTTTCRPVVNAGTVAVRTLAALQTSQAYTGEFS